MPLVPAPLREALEQRYDGPIPRQHLDHEGSKRRKKRGSLSLLEQQITTYLDAAEHCQAEIEELSAEIRESNDSPGKQGQLRTLKERCDIHIRTAADALLRSIDLRQQLGLAPHPLIALLDTIASSR